MQDFSVLSPYTRRFLKLRSSLVRLGSVLPKLKGSPRLNEPGSGQDEVGRMLDYIYYLRFLALEQMVL